METNQTTCHCLNRLGGKNKKILMLLGIIVVTVIVIFAIAEIIHSKIQRDFSYGNNNAGIVRHGKNTPQIYPAATAMNDKNNFVLPSDASRSGEIAIVVGNMDMAIKGVTDIAAKNSGSVYASLIAYASDNVKNGSMVVQIPVGNFDNAFTDLKKVGSKIVQESTQQVEKRDSDVQIMNSEGRAVAAPVLEKDTATIEGEATAVKKITDSQDIASVKSSIEPAIFPAPIPSLQNKGYIRVVFVDYGKDMATNNSGITINADNSKALEAANLLGVGYTGQNLRSNPIVVIGIKMILVITMAAILIIIIVRIFKRLHRKKVSRSHAHVQVRQAARKPVVRQAAKASPRVVRIKKN